MIETKEIEQEVSLLVKQIGDVVVVDAESYSRTAEELVFLKSAKKKILAWFKPHKDALNKAKDLILASEKAEIAKIDPLIDIRDKAMTMWAIAEEDRRKAEEEKLRLEAIKREEDERLNAAAQAEKEGNKEEAEAILAEPIHVACPIIPINVARVNGLTMRETWQFRVTDLKALVKAVADGKVPLMAIKPDDTFLGQQARSLKGTVQYPGIEFFSVKNMTGVRR